MREFFCMIGKALLFIFKVFSIFAPKNKDEEKMEDIYCPVCGYYCSGKGGHGCIDKPNLVYGKKDKQ